jgi:uncharacterized protein affecting Mg2+/Co2+ transport
MYDVQINNVRSMPIKILSRRWYMTPFAPQSLSLQDESKNSDHRDLPDSSEAVEVDSGEGLGGIHGIGEQTIKPGDAFRYQGVVEVPVIGRGKVRKQVTEAWGVREVKKFFTRVLEDMNASDRVPIVLSVVDANAIDGKALIRISRAMSKTNKMHSLDTEIAEKLLSSVGPAHSVVRNAIKASIKLLRDPKLHGRRERRSGVLEGWFLVDLGNGEVIDVRIDHLALSLDEQPLEKSLFGVRGQHDAQADRVE